VSLFRASSPVMARAPGEAADPVARRQSQKGGIPAAGLGD